MAVRFVGVLKGSFVDFFFAGGSDMPQMYSNVKGSCGWSRFGVNCTICGKLVRQMNISSFYFELEN